MFAIEGLSNSLEKIVPHKKEWVTTYMENNKKLKTLVGKRDEFLESYMDKIYLHPGVKWVLLFICIFICIIIGVFIWIFLDNKKEEKKKDKN